MHANTKTSPMRRSSSDRTYVIPIQIERAEQPNELEQIADEAIRILAEQLRDAERERDSLKKVGCEILAFVDSAGMIASGDGPINALRSVIQ